MTKTCPACGQEATGRFCSQCGVGLEGPQSCRECGNELPAGGRFCNSCGTPANLPAASALNQPEPPPAPPARSNNLAWVVAAGAVVALLAVLLVPRFQGDDPAAPLPASGPPITGTPGDPSRVDLSSMTPREAADRLFNRVMQNVSSGDTAAARQFLPMALMAYERVPELDIDGRYHLAVLQLVNDDPQAARVQADSILALAPDHLFGLFTAAQAEQSMGNEAAARELYQRFLDNFDAQVDADRQEYREHAQTLPALQEEAQRAVQGG